MQAIISIQDLEFAYKKRKVLEAVNLTVSSRECIGIIGPNGGGKTTLLKLLIGFLQPSCGKVSILGHAPKDVCKKMSYVPQSGSYEQDFPISVKDVVLAGRLAFSPYFYSKQDREKVDEVLERLRLSHLKDDPFSSLSGGQAQRVLIARALVAEPEILLLDEPTANIDSEASERIYEIIQELRGEITILMVTHHLQSVLKLVDRIWTVEGKVSSMAPEEVCKHFVVGLYHTRLKEKS